jgi:hypothetical protein
MTALWVNVRKAAKFPEVMRVYKKAGRGQGTGQGIIPTGPVSSQLVSEPKGFLRTIQIFFQGEIVQNASVPTLPSWLRIRPGLVGSQKCTWQDCQVDVTNIPGVRPLRDNGKWTSFDH